MRWRDFFLRNRWQKAFSLFLATLIWFAVQSDNSLTRTIAGLSGATRTFSVVPVAILTAPQGAGRFRVSPAAVEVVVRGDASVLARLERRDVEAYVSLTGGVPQGGQSMTLHVHAPAGVQLAWVTPAEVSVDYLPAGKNSP